MTEIPECPDRKGPDIPGGRDRANVRLAFAVGVSLLLHVLAALVPVSGEGGFPRHMPSLPDAPRNFSLALRPAVPAGLHVTPAVPATTSTSRPDDATAESGPETGNPRSSPHGRYVSVRQLTRLPQALTRFEDLLEGSSITASGRIEFRLWLNETGGIDRVEPINATLAADAAEELLIAFRKMRFLPGELGGRPVASVGHIVIELDDPGIPPEHPSLTPLPAPAATEN